MYITGKVVGKLQQEGGASFARIKFGGVQRGAKNAARLKFVDIEDNGELNIGDQLIVRIDRVIPMKQPDGNPVPIENIAVGPREYNGVTEIGKEVYSRTIPQLNCKPMTTGPAIEGCMIPVIRKITPRSIMREEEETGGRCLEWLDIDNPGTQILERCTLPIYHSGPHKYKYKYNNVDEVQGTHIKRG